MSYEVARVYSLDGVTQFRDYYGVHGPIDGDYTPDIGDRGFMDYAAAVVADAARTVDMAILHTPLKIQQDIEDALTPVPPV